MRTYLLIGLAALGLALPTRAPGASNVAKDRRQQLDVLRDEVRRKTLLARSDIRADSPMPLESRSTELLDGSFYQHADAGIAFEALAPVKVERMSLRDNGSLLLLTLVPPSRIVPIEMLGRPAPEIGPTVLMDVEVPEGQDVRSVLETLLYLPGQAPDEEAVQACLQRYPDQDERRSRLRCSPLPGPER